MWGWAVTSLDVEAHPALPHHSALPPHSQQTGLAGSGKTRLTETGGLGLRDLSTTRVWKTLCGDSGGEWWFAVPDGGQQGAWAAAGAWGLSRGAAMGKGTDSGTL